jgi:adenylyltransferase/sulfurtransferase
MREIIERYARQTALREIGAEGQAKLAGSCVMVVGCGALGCAQAQLLARAGVGRLRIVDRDLLELSNLQRQTLFEEEDLASGLPKAEAAARRLRKINSEIEVEGLAADITARNIEPLLRDADLVLDATDNVETRYLLNDACVKLAKPWIYGGAVGCSGMLMAIAPGAGPCLRCLFSDPPPPGSLPTCDVSGVLNAAPAVIGALQVAEAIRLLVGEPPTGHLTSVELWPLSFRQIEVKRDAECACCGRGQYEFLEAMQTSTAASLCGRNAVQITPARACTLPLDSLARQLEKAGRVTRNGLLLRLSVGELELAIFPDGRAIVHGTSDPAVARSLYSRFVGG